MIKGTVNGLAVDFAGAFHQFTLSDIRTDGELPVSSCLGLGHDVMGVLTVRNDFSGDFQSIVFDAGRNHSDTAVSFVFMVCQQRNGIRDLHSRQIDHYREFPSRQIHLSTAVGKSGNFRFTAVGSFNERKFTHLFHSPVVGNLLLIPWVVMPVALPGQGCRTPASV